MPLNENASQSSLPSARAQQVTRQRRLGLGDQVDHDRDDVRLPVLRAGQLYTIPAQVSLRNCCVRFGSGIDCVPDSANANTEGRENTLACPSGGRARPEDGLCPPAQRQNLGTFPLSVL